MLEYKIIRSNRKTLALEVGRDGELIVRSPMRTKERFIRDFVFKNEEWAIKHLKKREELNKNKKPELSESEIKELKSKAKEILTEKTLKYAEIMGLKPTYVKITSAKGRLGSCSSKGAVCYSYRLMLYPDECIDYVVVHELSHLVEMNHSERFYEVVKKYYPDYKKAKEMIKTANP